MFLNDIHTEINVYLHLFVLSFTEVEHHQKVVFIFYDTFINLLHNIFSYLNLCCRIKYSIPNKQNKIKLSRKEQQMLV